MKLLFFTAIFMKVKKTTKKRPSQRQILAALMEREKELDESLEQLEKMYLDLLKKNCHCVEMKQKGTAKEE